MKNRTRHFDAEYADSVLAHIREDGLFYAVSECPWHFQISCFVLWKNFEQGRFHCLYCMSSRYWMFYRVGPSYDVPEYFHGLIQLDKKLGSEYALPFSTQVQERAGYTVSQFEIRTGLYGSE